MTLRLPYQMLAEMIQHAELDWPIEACGVLVGRPATWHQREAFGDIETEAVFTRHVPLRNVAESEHTYCADPRDQLELFRELDETDEEILVVYHSHTHASSVASGVDEAYARQANAHYLILSVRNRRGVGPKFEEMTAYRCDGSGLAQVPVEVVTE